MKFFASEVAFLVRISYEYLSSASHDKSFDFSHVSIRLTYSARVIGKPAEPKQMRNGRAPLQSVA